MKTTTLKFNPETEMTNNKNNLKRRLRMAAVTAAIGFICANIFSAKAADVAGMKTLNGHIPAAVSRLQLKAEADLPTGTNLSLSIGLPLRNTNELKSLLEQVYDPSSPNYHHFLTPEQFTEKFGPTKEDYQMVQNFVRVNHLNIKATHSNRVLLDVTGKAADIEKAFNVKLHVYQHPGENRKFFAPDREPSVSTGLPILHLSGLNNYASVKPAFSRRPSNQPIARPAGSPNLGTSPGGNFEGNDFRNAYVPGTPLKGTGQNVALLQFDNFYSSDIAAYENQIGLTANVPNLVVVPVDGGQPTPTPFGNPEVSLDIEMVLSMSPGVSNIYVYEGPFFSSINVFTEFEDILNRIANDNVAKQISCSWFIINGGPDPAAEQIFQQMALQGQSFFTASGDSDAYTGLIPFPSDSPHITLVGGTTLTMNGAGASYASETVWNWGTEFGEDGVGSSGGVSTTYSIPSWQTNINMPARGGSATMRNVPDVALTGDHVWVIFGSGQADWFGGTSCASPLWAGFMALVNQQAVGTGHGPVGFLNPALYAIANSANYTNCFHDTTTGNNEWSQSPGLFSASVNYDLCTGLGTPNGTNLISALAGANNGITHLSPPPPPYGATLSGLNGQNPNGNWELFVLDNANFNSGAISNGWILKLATANPVGFSGDLAIGMTASAGSILLSNTVVYTLTVTNYGPSLSSNVLVSDNLPFSSTFVSASVDKGVVLLNGQAVNWNVGNLATNSGSQMLLTLRLNSVGDIVNFADADATTPDANASDDFASATVTVVSGSPPSFSSVVALPNGTFQLTVLSPPFSTIIQASTNLVDWVGIYTNTPPFTFTDPNATSYPHRFYRAITP